MADFSVPTIKFAPKLRVVAIEDHDIFNTEVVNDISLKYLCSELIFQPGELTDGAGVNFVRFTVDYTIVRLSNFPVMI